MSLARLRQKSVVVGGGYGEFEEGRTKSSNAAATTTTSSAMRARRSASLPTISPIMMNIKDQLLHLTLSSVSPIVRQHWQYSSDTFEDDLTNFRIAATRTTTFNRMISHHTSQGHKVVCSDASYHLTSTMEGLGAGPRSSIVTVAPSSYAVPSLGHTSSSSYTSTSSSMQQQIEEEEVEEEEKQEPDEFSMLIERTVINLP